MYIRVKSIIFCIIEPLECSSKSSNATEKTALKKSFQFEVKPHRKYKEIEVDVALTILIIFGTTMFLFFLMRWHLKKEVKEVENLKRTELALSDTVDGRFLHQAQGLIEFMLRDQKGPFCSFSLGLRSDFPSYTHGCRSLAIT